MQYVYVLQSLRRPVGYYTGCTKNVAERLRKHNAGQAEARSRHASMYGPWKLIVQTAFQDDAKAFAFENYLKSGSARALAKRHC
jgi:putative endonuclease